MNKSILLVGTLALISSAIFLFNMRAITKISSPSEEILENWNNFKSTYEKVYENVDIEAYRMKVFIENLEMIQNHQGKTYTLGVNAFADLTNEEFKSIYLGLLPQQKQKQKNDQKSCRKS